MDDIDKILLYYKHVQVLQLVGVGSIKSGPALHAYGF